MIIAVQEKANYGWGRQVPSHTREFAGEQQDKLRVEDGNEENDDFNLLMIKVRTKTFMRIAPFHIPPRRPSLRPLG